MPIEKNAGLFYEMMIRGNHDPAQGDLGKVMTYQLQTGTALVDTDSNTLAAPYAVDLPVDLTKEQAVAFLDDKFAGFLDQLTAERAKAQSDAAAAKQEADATLKQAQDAAASAIADLKAQIATLTNAHADLAARNAAAAAALAPSA